MVGFPMISLHTVQAMAEIWFGTVGGTTTRNPTVLAVSESTIMMVIMAILLKNGVKTVIFMRVKVG